MIRQLCILVLFELVAVAVALVAVIVLPTLPPSMYPLYGLVCCVAVVCGAVAAELWMSRGSS